MTTVRLKDRWSSDEIVVEIEPVDRRARDGRYRVILPDGRRVEIERGKRSWDRIPKGLRYRTAWGETPCWRVGGEPYWRTFDTRKEAILWVYRN